MNNKYKPKYCFICIGMAYLPNTIPNEYIKMGMSRNEYYQHLLNNCHHRQRFHKQEGD
jgi:hypothetical protein